MIAVLILAVALPCFAQSNGGRGDTPPAACMAGDLFVRTGATAPGVYFCSATNTWSQAGGGSESVPVGSILLIKAGTCPTGYTEDADLNGKALVGTLQGAVP